MDLSAVDGKIIMKNQKLINIDENESFERVKKYPSIIGENGAKEFFEINGTNARFMREGKL